VLDDDVSAWSAVHIDYGNELSPPFSPRGSQSKIFEVLAKYNLDASLLNRNKFTDELMKPGPTYLVHFSDNIDDVIESGRIFSSSGCLVGSIYSTLAFRADEGLVLSDLGEYIANFEIPLSRKAKLRGALKPEKCILIKVENTPQVKVLGLDYLSLGEIHYKIFKKLSYLLSRQEFATIEEDVIRSSSYACSQLKAVQLYENSDISSSDLVDTISKQTKKVYLLGYIFFEGLSLFLCLSSKDRESTIARSNGEIPNRCYKQLIFNSRRILYNQFDLTELNYSVSELEDLVFRLNDNLDARIPSAVLIDFLADYFCVAFRKYLAGDDFEEVTSLRYIQESQVKFAGHTIHRLLRNMNRSSDFYYYFEQTKALEIWNFWNMSNVLLPFNGLLPKGEIGINPAFPQKNESVYSAELIYGKGSTIVRPIERVDCGVAPRLVDLKYTFMRWKK